MLGIEDFTKRVELIVSELKNEGIQNRSYSDLLDGAGNQYVDLVQEGGGVLGIALVGYTYLLEEMGVRFYGVGGTSAGAINTLMLASAGKLEESKSRKILNIISETNLFDFIDGPYQCRELIKSFTYNHWFPFKLFWAVSSLSYFLFNKGLNPGKAFYDWLIKILKSNYIFKQSDLDKRRINPPGFHIREGVNQTLEGLHPKVKILAAEVSTETRVIFPQMNDLFWSNPGEASPAEYVRASMSIPGFFIPHSIKIGKSIDPKIWEDKSSYTGAIPEEAIFVDGGVMSNFPIDLFHNKGKIPRMPTFGVKLNDDRNKKNPLDPVANYLMAIFNSSRHVLDYQFLLRHADYKHLITKIALENHDWLNFSMKDEEKLDLFEKGVRAAADFLRKFNWEEYKEIRRKLIVQEV